MIKSVQTWSMEVADTRVLKMKINAGRADLSAAATTAASEADGAARGKARLTAADDHEMCGGKGGGEGGKGERGDKNGHERVGCGGGGLGASAEARGDHSAGPLRWPGLQGGAESCFWEKYFG